MEFLEKLIKTLKDNLGYTIILAISVLLFGIFSDGLIKGLITAASALIAYICIDQLYRKYPKKK